jgi:hypothetical protein
VDYNLVVHHDFVNDILYFEHFFEYELINFHIDFHIELNFVFHVNLNVFNDNDGSLMEENKPRYWDVVWSRKYERYNRHHREIWEAVLPHMQGSVIDLGCGPCVMYENTTIDLTGLDQSIEGLKQAQKHYPQGKYVFGDATKTPFLEKSFDTCMMLGLIDYHCDIGPFVREAQRITRKKIIATVLNGWHGHDWSNPPFPCIARVGTWMVLDIPVCAQ